MKSITSSTSLLSATNAGGSIPPTSLFPVTDFASASNALCSNNIQQVVKGVNFVLQKSFEANQDSSTSTVVQLENQPRLLYAISDLLDLLNPAAALLEKEIDTNISYHVLLEEEIDGHAWSTELIGSKIDEFKVHTNHYGCRVLMFMSLYSSLSLSLSL
jgi:hypothetical protein